jgi:hypothetical protein
MNMNENKNINPIPPHIGEVRTGFNIGYSNFGRYVWQSCARCQIERWVKLNKGVPVATLCKKCWHISPSYRAKPEPEYIHKNGYIMTKIPKDSPYIDMGNRDGYTLKQRLVMAEFIGRSLKAWEKVYFNDDNITNCDIDNLRLFGCSSEYNIKLEQDVITLTKQVKDLYAQNMLLSSIILLLKEAGKDWFKLVYEDVTKTP